MESSAHREPPVSSTSEALPFVAPCKQLDSSAPLRWLRLGWEDLKRAPRLSLAYGAVIVLLSYLVSLLALKFGGYILLLSLLSGFILIGPVMAIGLYSISCQLARGQTPRLGHCLRAGAHHISNEMIFALILLVIFLVWARAASIVHVFFPLQAPPTWSSLVPFLAIGSAVGTVFAAAVFSASAFSLPMIMDRKVEVVTAVVTSINAVLRNRSVMLLWASIIVIALGIGFATAFLGLGVLLPWLGHATWHAYRETIVPEAWPEHGEIGS